MIYLGDIACPNPEHALIIENFLTSTESIKNKFLFGNLEGLINDEEIPNNTPVLYNHSSVLKVLKNAGLLGVSLANNHILDLPNNFELTLHLLKDLGIEYGGATKDVNAINDPVITIENGNRIATFCICWEFLLYHQKNPTGGVTINTYKENIFLKTIKEYKQKWPSDKIIVFPHWSFDLEKLPFPMYRQWSKALIDHGVNCVVGCHSHCIQGGEKYKEGYIIYGLGNFYIPNNVFADGKLSFPKMSQKEMLFEWDPISNKAMCHWVEYSEENTSNILKYIGQENFDDSNTLKTYSPYQNMEHNDYIDFYKKNRRKGFLIPVFADYKQELVNNLKMFLLKSRAKMARSLAERGILKWQS